MINDSLAQLRFGTGMDRYQHYASEMLLRCVTAADEPARAILDEYATVLGQRLGDRRFAAAAMERFVLAAGAESDEALLRCFAHEIEHLALALEPVAGRPADPALPPIDL